MRFRSWGVLMLGVALCLVPQRAPAPLIYRPARADLRAGGRREMAAKPGQGPAGSAQQAFDEGKFKLATKARPPA
jgi:hypothetical protein